MDFDRYSRPLVPGFIISVGISIAVGLYFSSPEPAMKKSAPNVIFVDALQVKKSDVLMTVNTQGEVLAKTRTKLVSEVSGVITQLSRKYVAGGAFLENETLISVDDRNYVADVKKARAALATAKTDLAEEKGLAEYALSDWSRSNRNSKRKPSDLALRKPQIAEAESNLEFAMADLVRREGDLARTRVTAFYDGIVESKDVDLGQFVSPGTKLGVIFAIDLVEVRLPISMHEIEFLDLPEPLGPPGKEVAVTFTAISGRKPSSWHGSIIRTEAVLDRKNRVLYAIAEVANPYHTGEAGWTTPLRVGAFVNARINGKQYSDMIVVPRAAVRPGNKIWIINAENRLEVREITPLRTDENFLYIQHGLEDGDILSITPLENPLPGTEVRYNLISANDLSSY